MFSVAERYWIANVTFGYIVVRGSQRAKVPKQQPKNNNKSIQWKINVSLASNIAVSLLWITFAIHIKFDVVDNVNVILLFFHRVKFFRNPNHQHNWHAVWNEFIPRNPIYQTQKASHIQMNPKLGNVFAVICASFAIVI